MIVNWTQKKDSICIPVEYILINIYHLLLDYVISFFDLFYFPFKDDDVWLPNQILYAQFLSNLFVIEGKRSILNWSSNCGLQNILVQLLLMHKIKYQIKKLWQFQLYSIVSLSWYRWQHSLNICRENLLSSNCRI